MPPQVRTHKMQHQSDTVQQLRLISSTDTDKIVTSNKFDTISEEDEDEDESQETAKPAPAQTKSADGFVLPGAFKACMHITVAHDSSCAGARTAGQHQRVHVAN